MRLRAAALASVLVLGCARGLRAQEPCDVPFLRGDSNVDGKIDISDGIRTLLSLFAGGEPLGCLDAADANDSSSLDISDAVFIFGYLFTGGEPPPLPGIACGIDPTPDPLGCAAYAPCPDDCRCQDGDQRPCGSSDVGECVRGVQSCDGGQWGPCEGSVEPVPELCDSLDNDCDGEVDEAFDEDGDGFTTCGGDCDDADPSVNPGQEVDPIDGKDNDCDETVDEGPFTTSYAGDIQPVWDQSCTSAGCHDAMFPASGLDLTPAVSYGGLVDHPSDGVPGMDRVEPGDPDRSYLWHKLNNTQRDVGGTGSSMPRGEPLLPAATRDTIRTWILEGCPP